MHKGEGERETVEEIYDDGAIDFESNKPFCAVYKECGGGTVERKDIYGAIDIGLHNHITILNHTLLLSPFLSLLKPPQLIRCRVAHQRWAGNSEKRALMVCICPEVIGLRLPYLLGREGSALNALTLDEPLSL